METTIRCKKVDGTYYMRTSTNDVPFHAIEKIISDFRKKYGSSDHAESYYTVKTEVKVLDNKQKEIR